MSKKKHGYNHNAKFHRASPRDALLSSMMTPGDFLQNRTARRESIRIMIEGNCTPKNGLYTDFANIMERANDLAVEKHIPGCIRMPKDPSPKLFGMMYLYDYLIKRNDRDQIYRLLGEITETAAKDINIKGMIPCSASDQFIAAISEYLATLIFERDDNAKKLFSMLGVPSEIKEKCNEMRAIWEEGNAPEYRSKKNLCLYQDLQNIMHGLKSEEQSLALLYMCYVDAGDDFLPHAYLAELYKGGIINHLDEYENGYIHSREYVSGGEPERILHFFEQMFLLSIYDIDIETMTENTLEDLIKSVEKTENGLVESELMKPFEKAIAKRAMDFAALYDEKGLNGLSDHLLKKCITPNKKGDTRSDYLSGGMRWMDNGYVIQESWWREAVKKLSGSPTIKSSIIDTVKNYYRKKLYDKLTEEYKKTRPAKLPDIRTRIKEDAPACEDDKAAIEARVTSFIYGEVIKELTEGSVKRAIDMAGAYGRIARSTYTQEIAKLKEENDSRGRDLAEKAKQISSLKDKLAEETPEYTKSDIDNLKERIRELQAENQQLSNEKDKLAEENLRLIKIVEQEKKRTDDLIDQLAEDTTDKGYSHTDLAPIYGMRIMFVGSSINEIYPALKKDFPNSFLIDRESQDLSHIQADMVMFDTAHTSHRLHRRAIQYAESREVPFVYYNGSSYKGLLNRVAQSLKENAA